jgi:hypothetical protein
VVTAVSGADRRTVKRTIVADVGVLLGNVLGAH